MKTIQKNNSQFPHSDNILEIINSLNLPIPSNTTAYLSGGFALALLYAERQEDHSISNQYYSDIDLYFHRLADYRATFNSFNLHPDYKIVSDTDKESYAKFVSGDYFYKVGVVKKIVNDTALRHVDWCHIRDKTSGCLRALH